MKTLYFDCGMGAAGDMLSAALLELFDDKQAVLDELNALGIPGVEFKAEVSTKCRHQRHASFRYGERRGGRKR